MSDEDEPHAAKRARVSDGGSQLVMDAHMHEARRADKKARHWAQTQLKKARRTQDVKFFNKLISDFGTAKQLGFSFQVLFRYTLCGGVGHSLECCPIGEHVRV